MLRAAAHGIVVKVDFTFHDNAFPDIKVNGFGVEAKYSKRDTWSSVANSIFEGMRDPTVNEVYVMFGKGGRQPEARWASYRDCVTHVRTSNAPRFVVDLDSDEKRTLRAECALLCPKVSQIRLDTGQIHRSCHIRPHALGRPMSTGSRLVLCRQRGGTRHAAP